jgi:DNA (cytosine-5)-methyltransferase 1
MKILNLYACLGGNRYKWGNEHEIVAVEWDEELAKLYKERFPNDEVVVADAHEYLLKNFRSFDFIWSSPPCPSHSRAAFGSRKSTKAGHKPVYPDMKLYQEIIFLQHYFDGKFVVENVVPYYEPLIYGHKRGRHIYWTNFRIPSVLSERKSISMESRNEIDQWCEFHDYNFRKYNGKQTVQKIARNLVDYEAGKTILDAALGVMRKQNTNQTELF